MTMMRRLDLAAVLCALALPAPLGAAWAQDRIETASGQGVSVLDIIWDDEARTARFRFLAPQIAEPGFDPAPVLDDLALLCRDHALPILRQQRPGWSSMVLSLSSAPVPFGVSDASVVQFFEAFDAVQDDCIWSQF